MKKELNYLASKRWEKVGGQELRSTPCKQEINPWNRQSDLNIGFILLYICRDAMCCKQSLIPLLHPSIQRPIPKRTISKIAVQQIQYFLVIFKESVWV
jgi:hypothetical protein